jgi:tRNA dimethylallyltransferase
MAIVGPTSVGKTRLAIALTQRLDGEVINADSRQVYRHMDIGTAKPTQQERQQTAHHLLDIRDPNESFSLGSFLSLSREAINDIQRRGRTPMVVGGTGQYIWALMEGWDVPHVLPNEEFRRTKEQEAQEKGVDFLHQQLQQIDPQRAAELDPHNVRRVIRALEIYRATQCKPSDYRKRMPQIIDPLVIGLTLPREELYQRIDQRVDRMMEIGLLDEVRNLVEMGYQEGQGPMDSPGYRELGQHLAGEISLKEAVQRTKFQTHRLARRQYAWFKLNNSRICWLDASDPQLDAKAARLTMDFLGKTQPVLQ